MPSVSQAQQRLMVIAEHDPDSLYAKNKGVANMTHQQLHDFASTRRKGLPKRKRVVVRKKR
jgi:hypothetical protein